MVQVYRDVDSRGLFFVALAGAWLVGILLGSWFARSIPDFDLLIAAGIALILIVVLWRDRPSRFVACLAFGLLLGAWRYDVAAPAHDPHAISSFISPSEVAIRGTVVAEPAIYGHTRVLSVEAQSIKEQSGWLDVRGEMAVQTLGIDIEDRYGANFGDTVEVRGKLQRPLPDSPPGIFARMFFPRISVLNTGSNPILSFVFHLRVVLANTIERSLPQPAAALLVAILLNLRTPALKPITAAFNVTGVSHLVAASGFNVTLISGMLERGMSRFHAGEEQSVFTPGYLGNWRRMLSSSIVLIGISAYVVLSGAGPSIMRAGIMGSLLVIAPRVGRVYNVYTALGLSAVIQSLVDPFTLWDVGFQLSFLGTLGLVVLARPAQRLFRGIEHFPGGRSVAEACAVTLAAQVATLPIIAVNFHQVSLIAPVTNMVTEPLFGLLILLGMLVCLVGFVALPLARVIGWVVWPLLTYVIKIASWCASLPGAFINVGELDVVFAWGYYALLILVVTTLLKSIASPSTPSQHTPPHKPLLSPQLWRRAQLILALLVILGTGATALASPPQKQLTVTFLSVGPADQPPQGEAILVRTPDKKTILIDGGPDATSLSQALDSRLPPWQRTLDTSILTTSGTDHLTALLDIVSRYTIIKAIDAGMLHPGTTYSLWRRRIIENNVRYLPVVQGATLPIGEVIRLQILWPTQPLHKGSNEIRDNSLILRMVGPGIRILFVGAAAQSAYALRGLLNSVDPAYLMADIVQVTGATSYPGELQAVLKRARPSLLIMTPALLSSQQKRTGSASADPGPLSLPGDWQVISTVYEGTIELTSNKDGWSIRSG